MNTKQNKALPVSRMEYAEQKCEDKCDTLVTQNPLSSVLVVFAIGIGIGVVLGNALGGTVVPHPSFGQRTGVAAEKVGRQILDAIAGVFPESISRHISS